MSKSESLVVEVREERGRRKVKRLRAEGKIPAVIYGHGEPSISLSVPADQISKLVHRGERLVGLTGGVTGDAFIREVQWDVFGSNVVHVDFTRVQAGEMLATTVSINARGEAPGTKMGGTLEQPLNEIEILCPPRSMTDHIDVMVNELGLDQKITIADLLLPEGAEAVLPPETVVVQCVENAKLKDEDEDDAPASGGVEPEVIGKKADEGGQEGS